MIGTAETKTGPITIIEEDLTRFVRFLGHERFCIKSVRTGEKGAQEAHFDLINANKAVDYIKLRNGQRQLWVNVQRLKKEAKQYHAFDDIEAYSNIFIDIDAKKPDDKKDFAATERERGFALGQLPTVQAWLDGQGFKPGLAFKSGNGAGLLLPIPPTEPTPEFIAKVAAFLKVVRSEANVDVDTTTFDPPRVCGVLGTWNSKLEAEPEGRKNQLREAIGDIPTRDEDEALLRYIERLKPDPEALRTWTEKFNETTTEDEAVGHDEAKPDTDEVDVDFVKAKLDTLLEADPKLQGLLDWSEEEKERHSEDRSRAEYGLVGKLTAAGFTDPQINWIMTCVSKIGKWAEEDYHYRFEMTLNKIRAKDAEEEAVEAPSHRRAGAGGFKLEDVGTWETVRKRGPIDEETGKAKLIPVKTYTFSPEKATEAILERYDIITTPDEAILVYEDGIFKPGGEFLIEKELATTAGDYATIRQRQEVLARVVLMTRIEYEELDSQPYLFPVENGVIDLRRGTSGFMPHSPKYKRTWKSPVTFDPKATCPEIEKYITSSLDEAGRNTYIDILAAKLSAYNFPFFSPWVGRGRNGKRMATEIIRGIFGDSLITEVEIHKFHERRFDQIEVRGRHFIINSEVPRTATKGFDWIKKISGGDPITADVKGREQVQFRPHALIIFDCNNPPKIDDYTKAIEERIAPIWWNYSFVDKPNTKDAREKQRDPHLEEKITRPAELSGFLNVLLQEAPRLIETRAIRRAGTGAELIEAYDLKSDHLAIFWDRFMVYQSGAATSSTRAHDRYKELCAAVQVSHISPTAFNAYGQRRGFRKGRPYVTDDDGKSVRMNGWFDCLLDEEEFEILLQKLKGEDDQPDDKTGGGDDPERQHRTHGTGEGTEETEKNPHPGMESTDIPDSLPILDIERIKGDDENTCIERSGNENPSIPFLPSASIDSSDKNHPKTAKKSSPLDVGRTGLKDGRVFGLSLAYYKNLGRGQLPTVRALMDDQGWDVEKAKMAIGILEQMGLRKGFNCPD